MAKTATARRGETIVAPSPDGAVFRWNFGQWVRRVRGHVLEEIFVPVILAPFPHIAATICEAPGICTGRIASHRGGQRAYAVNIGLRVEGHLFAPGVMILGIAGPRRHFPFAFGWEPTTRPLRVSHGVIPADHHDGERILSESRMADERGCAIARRFQEFSIFTVRDRRDRNAKGRKLDPPLWLIADTRRRGALTNQVCPSRHKIGGGDLRLFAL